MLNYTVLKSGSNRTFTIENGEVIKNAMPSRCFCVLNDDGSLVVRATNKSEAAAVELVIKNAHIKTEPKIHVGNSGSVAIRRVVLARMAKGTCGKSWYATGKNIDEMQLPPEWEGELVCYQYSE